MLRKMEEKIMQKMERKMSEKGSQRWRPRSTYGTDMMAEIPALVSLYSHSTTSD